MESSNFHALFLAIFLLFSFIQTGSSLKCVSCNEAEGQEGPKCGDPYKSARVAQCEQTEEVCVKHKQPKTDIQQPGEQTETLKTNIIRGCKPKDYCSKVDNYSEHCSTCTTDECNISTIVTPSIIIISVAIVKNYFI